MLRVSLIGGLLLIAAYLLGSIPTGYLVGRLIKGIDIRQYGSGGTGATNVLRTVGKPAAVLVLMVDILKGAAAIFLVKWLYPWALGAAEPGASAILYWVITGAGLLALLGHSKSIWIRFTGGKSAATGLGVVSAMAWPVGLGSFVMFLAVLGISRIVSLGSMAAALSAGLLMVVTGQPLPYQLLGIAGGLYVIVRHRTNIQRLLAGTEPRLGQKAKISGGQ